MRESRDPDSPSIPQGIVGWVLPRSWPQQPKQVLPSSAMFSLRSRRFSACLPGILLLAFAFRSPLPSQSTPPRGIPIVLRAAGILDLDAGKVTGPGEILIRNNRIAEVGSHVSRPPDAQILDLGNRTLMPGLIDAHVHLFLHPGAEDLQTVEESVPQRTILALLAAKADLLAGFTAERDMGTEGAARPIPRCGMPSMQIWSRVPDCASAVTPSTSSADTKMPIDSTPRSMCFRTPVMRTTPTS